MPTFDPIRNFPYSTVGIAPTVADGFSTMSFAPGGAYEFPRGAHFDIVVYQRGVRALRTNAEIVRTLLITTTLAAGSDGDDLPQTDIFVADSGDFQSGGGTCTVITDDGPQIVTYTGTASGKLTGCTGGTGEMGTGDEVVDDHVTLTRNAEDSKSRTILVGDQVEAAITVKTLQDIYDALNSVPILNFEGSTASPAAVTSTDEAAQDILFDCGEIDTTTGTLRVIIKIPSLKITSGQTGYICIFMDALNATSRLIEFQSDKKVPVHIEVTLNIAPGSYDMTVTGFVTGGTMDMNCGNGGIGELVGMYVTVAE